MLTVPVGVTIERVEGEDEVGVEGFLGEREEGPAEEAAGGAGGRGRVAEDEREEVVQREGGYRHNELR